MVTQTWLELNPYAGVILNLFDHLTVSTDYNSYGEPWYGDLVRTEGKEGM